MESVTTTTSIGGVTVVGSDAPSDYHIASRTDNLNSNPTPVSAAPPPPITAAQPPRPLADAAGIPLKKKRGRPRKYGPDGAVTMPLSPKPISAAAVIDFSTGKRGKVKSPNSFSKARYEPESIGEWVACSVGANFTPHIITVNAGEDVTMKVISFSQQGPRAICILSANGVISSVTLRQPDSSGGTLTYEGRFEILSLSGSFMPNDSGGMKNRSGGMSISLASPDGRVVGGGVAGLLVAAAPVQVVVGSFLAGNQHEQKQKKQKHETITSGAVIAAVPVSSSDPRPNLSSPSSFHSDDWSSLPSDTRNNIPTDINLSVTGN